MATFHLFQDQQGRYRFTLVSDGGRTLAESEAYQSKDSAENGIESIRKNSADEGKFEIKPETSGGKGFYVSLKAGNGQVIAHSRSHRTMYTAKTAVASIVAQAGAATVVG